MWIIFALLTRLLWAGMNATDQLLSRVHATHKMMAALTIELLCNLLFAVIGYLFAPHVSLNLNLIGYCLGAALGTVLGSVPYFAVLRHEQSHDIVPYMEVTPIFFMFIAWFLKGETLTSIQLIGALIVIASGFLFSWDFAHARFKLKPMAYLAVASLFFAGYQYCVNEAQPLAGVLVISTFFYLARGLIGIALFCALKDVRQTIVKTFVKTKGKTAILAAGTGLLGVSGLGFLLLAFRYAPTGDHVAALSGTQPLFAFALAWPLAKLFPKHFTKMSFDHQAFAKLILIVFIGFGVYLLNAR